MFSIKTLLILKKFETTKMYILAFNILLIFILIAMTYAAFTKGTILGKAFSVLIYKTIKQSKAKTHYRDNGSHLYLY